MLTVPVTVAASPPDPLFDNAPRAPVVVMVMLDIPGGTGHGCSLPVRLKTHVVCVADAVHTGDVVADAGPASATDQSPNTPTVATSNPTARQDALRRPEPGPDDPSQNIAVPLCGPVTLPAACW